MTLKDLETLYTSLTEATSTSFIRSIRTARNNQGVATLDLLGFLDRIITEFLPEGRRICRMAPEISRLDKSMLTLHGKIIASAILVSHDTRSVTEMKEKTLLFLEYASAVVRAKYDFVGTAAKVVSYPITTTGFDWKTVEDASSLEIISYKVINAIRFDTSHPDYFQYTGKGKVVCNKGILTVYSAEVGEAGARAFSLYGGSVEVVSKNSRDEKLKSSDQNEVEAVGNFAEAFVKAQNAFVKGKTNKREYSSGDVVDIMITENGAGETCGRIVDMDNPLEGNIVNEELIRGTETGDVLPYFCEDDVIRGAELIIAADGTCRFSIQKAYEAYAKKLARRDDGNGTVFEAKVTRIRQDLKRINWMTPRGYGGISYLLEGEDLKPGDIRVMSVYNVQVSGSATYINLCPPRYGYDTVDYRFGNDEDVLADFVTTADRIRDTRTTVAETERAEDADTVRTLASIIANRAFGQECLDGYKALLASVFLRTAIGDAEDTLSLQSEAYYLSMKIAYAQGTPVPEKHPFQYDGERAEVLGFLSAATHPDGALFKRVAVLKEGSLPRRIGELLAVLWLSTEYVDQVKADPEDVRRRICDLLGVSGQYRPTTTSTKVGKYGKAETHEVEFKSSYVFRNDGKGADIDAQGRDEVFRTVCGFLNADGGTLYLGVSDAGEPYSSEDYGLQADMRWFRNNYQTVNAARSPQLGYPVTKVDSLDHYVHFLNEEKELYFRESLLGNIKIEVTQDADAIRITVTPAEYEIAYLYKGLDHSDGIAYERNGGRTVPMSPARKERRLMELKKISKEVGFIVTIHEAIDQHRKLIFKDYASGNSGKVADRFVVPVNLFYNDENVYCYDLQARKYKQFRLRRISSIETEFDNPYYPLPKVEPKRADVFRWVDEGSSYHIKLRMAIGAKNYLVEEYSCAEMLPKEELYPERPDVWILDTHVFGFGAVRRFYLGLADKIEILDTEDSDALKADIAAFIGESILTEND